MSTKTKKKGKKSKKVSGAKRLTKKKMLEKYGKIANLLPVKLHKKMEKEGVWIPNAQFLTKEEKIILIQKGGKGKNCKEIRDGLEKKMSKMRPLQAKNIKRAKAGESLEVAMERAKREGKDVEKAEARFNRIQKAKRKAAREAANEEPAEKKTKTKKKSKTPKKEKTSKKSKAKGKKKTSVKSKKAKGKSDKLFDDDGWS